jgi:hypothetical protein
MKLSNLFIIIVLFTLVPTGCGSDSDDGGGTVGGSGLLPYCQRDAGVYKYPDGSSFDLKPNCEFIVVDADGNTGHGKVNKVSEDGSFSADFILDTGPAKGTCATMNASPTGFVLNNVHQCT